MTGSFHDSFSVSELESWKNGVLRVYSATTLTTLVSALPPKQSVY